MCVILFCETKTWRETKHKVAASPPSSPQEYVKFTVTSFTITVLRYGKIKEL
jgi:hypothetical protein